MPKIITNPEKIDEILNRGTIVEILPAKKEFRDKLLSGEKLKLYIGFDATAPTLHLSHAKNIMLLEKFRRLGHEVIVLFGDFTARIGDPAGKNSARKQLSREEVIFNVERWKKLIEPLMDFKAAENPPKIMYNHDWLSRLNLENILNLAGNFTVQQMLERDMFQNRIKEEKPIYIHEFLYPLMQGYDSVAMDVDVEVCGTDQIFNALAGRTLLKKLKGKDKFVVAVTLMENPKTGELMSKSKGAGVFLDASANDMFGQIMAEPDEMIEILFVNCTYLSPAEIKKIMAFKNPKDAKMRLALEIVKLFYGESLARAAEQEFSKIFRDKGIPSEMPEFSPSPSPSPSSAPDDEQIQTIPILELLVQAKLASSKNEAKRLVEGNAVEIDGQIISDWKTVIEIKNGMVIRAGKRKFAKIIR